MASVSKAVVIVLWESELRAAADALMPIRRAVKEGKGIDPAEAWNALEACAAALANVASHPEANLVVCSAERLKYEPRDIHVSPRPATKDK